MAEWVCVAGEMVVQFQVQLPVDTAHEGVACDDPAVEAALQAVSQSFATYLWGTDKLPAKVDAEVMEHDVRIEEDDRLAP